MKRRKIGEAVLILAMAAGAAMCGRKDLDKETEDVVKAQNEAARQAVETPRDTAKVRDKAEKVIEEQKDVQKAMQEELKEKHIPATTTQ